MTFEKFNNKIVFSLINKENHQELLSKVPHKDYLDMAVVFYAYFTEVKIDEGNASMLVDNQLMEKWGVDVDTLMEHALENTPRLLGLKIRGIFSTIASYMDDEALTEIAEQEDKYTPLYVATNNIATYGAGVVLYKDMLKAFSARKKSDLYIIPCSIHELILVASSECEGMDVQELKKLIVDVNQFDLPSDEVLSDNLYFYNRKENKVSLVA